jgi:hypothetical protein
MNQALTWIVAIGLVAVTSALLYVASEVQKLRVVVAGSRKASFRTDVADMAGGHAHYVWDGQAWILSEDFSRPGFEPVRPQIGGSFEHQVLRTRSAPAQTRVRPHDH